MTRRKIKGLLKMTSERDNSIGKELENGASERASLREEREREKEKR